MEHGSVKAKLLSRVQRDLAAEHISLSHSERRLPMANPATSVQDFMDLTQWTEERIEPLSDATFYWHLKQGEKCVAARHALTRLDALQAPAYARRSFACHQ